jgi:DNA-binding transcriptional ArsR family regulator
MLLWVVPVGDGIDAVAEVLRAVASPLRLRILLLLDRSPLPVQRLARALGESQPLVSHHLGILRRAGLVAVHREGRQAVYSTTAEPVVGFAIGAVHGAVHDAARAAADDHWRTTMSAPAHTTHTDHEHAHGEGCGHVAFPHADHVDYAHDGHLHRSHDGHWDECESAGHAAHDSHDHAHGEACGHVAVPHGDHVDYLHDGHRHAAHEGHYDEH